jgi:dolichol kinase
MLAIVLCLIGVFILLIATEELFSKKYLRGEYLRKFLHITVGSFVAFWPWFISWQAIRIVGVAMLAGVLINHHLRIIKFNHISRKTYGDILLAVVIVAAALLTTSKIFFALAILHLSLADGFAAVVGEKYGKSWRYKIFNQTKSVLGSMTFWFVSLCILGTGALFAHEIINFKNYILLLLLLPPTLTYLENISPFGTDNIVVPIVALYGLHLAQVF